MWCASVRTHQQVESCFFPVDHAFPRVVGGTRGFVSAPTVERFFPLRYAKEMTGFRLGDLFIRAYRLQQGHEAEEILRWCLAVPWRETVEVVGVEKAEAQQYRLAHERCMTPQGSHCTRFVFPSPSRICKVLRVGFSEKKKLSFPSRQHGRDGRVADKTPLSRLFCSRSC